MLLPRYPWKSVFYYISLVIDSFLSQPSGSAIFDTDDRQFVDTSPGSPFAPIGLVLGAPKYATATLIDDCHALSSQHIFGLKRSPIGRRLTFVGGIGTRHRLSSGGTVVAAGGLERYKTSFQSYEARASDWLLLRLDTCLGTVLGTARLVVKIPVDTELAHVQSAGYSQDWSPRRLAIDPSCKISSVRPLVWLNDCATTAGDSGGPIFRVVSVNGHQQLQVYAIQSGAILKADVIPFKAGYENQATPAWQILPYILHVDKAK